MIVKSYPNLEKVVPLDDYFLELIYDNGERRIYDFKPNFEHKFYKDLQSPILFKAVEILDGLIEWPTGQDFCPHTLYDKSIKKESLNHSCQDVPRL